MVNKKINLKYVELSDYKTPDFLIPNISLNFIIEKNFVKVISEYTIVKKNLKAKYLILKGADIKLINLLVDNKKLSSDKFKLKEDRLIINFIDRNTFNLKIESLINPKINTSLLGLYESNNILTTQCEAEGFRKICFHPDRPDILSKFKVRIEADKDLYPVLLSNGNLIKRSILKDNRHEVFWADPFPKPSYLFALVAGKLECIEDHFITKSNRKILINLYIEKGDEKYVQHSIDSLKKAMRWDEEKYNLEYDLNLFNIVAIRHFNMGAMENKSLNIFNSKLVLANTETSTDEELERIEGVVAHEYFHNWTGNRITCRDWFQLSLKEGLTVFRDQEFTSDMHDYQVKRIEDVKFFRKHQFREDSSPTSHAVRPKRYLEIDNFYTTTIYEKGAEIIRMIRTIVKEEKFKIGFSNFISKYDGKAATIDEFVEAIIGLNQNINIKKFKLWYEQNGTPEVTFKRIWDKKNKLLTILIEQKNPNIKNIINKKPLLIPINIAIFTDVNKSQNIQYLLKDKKDKLLIKNINSKLDIPKVSYFREFSAPVKWQTDLSYEEELFILENETDSFTIFDSITRIYKIIITKKLENIDTLKIENLLFSSLKNIFINKQNINLSLLSELLNIPNLSELESELTNIDPLKIQSINKKLNIRLAKNLEKELTNKLIDIEYKINKIWPKGKEERKLIQVIWTLLLYCDNNEYRRKILKYVDSNNMTLSKAALTSFRQFDCIEREKASEKFFDKWKSNRIVIDNWFLFSASIESQDSAKNLDKLFEHSLFDPKSPNTLRSILNGYVIFNKSFHSKDGKGYDYVAKKITEFDKINPIVISRFLKIFSQWNSYAEPYRNNMLKSLNFIDSHKLSINSREVINLILSK